MCGACVCVRVCVCVCVCVCVLLLSYRVPLSLVCSVSVFGEHNCIKPRDTRQYLYRVTPSSWPLPKKGKDGKVGWMPSLDRLPVCVCVGGGGGYHC